MNSYKKSIIYTIMFAILLFGIIADLLPQFNGGSGSANDPYLVSSVADLYSVRNYPDSYFKQTTHLDISAYNSGLGWLPIGNENQPFSGIYDGNNYRIINLYINRPESNNIGLFGYITGSEDQQAIIKNVIIEGADITGNYNIGTLIGTVSTRYFKAYKCSAIGNQTTRGIVRGKSRTGGLIGYIENNNPTTPTINECFSNIEVRYIGVNPTEESAFGGFIGYVSRTEIKDCFSLGAVYGCNTVDDITYYPSYVGGFVGYARLQQGGITTSFSTGYVCGLDENGVGGFAGNTHTGGTGGITNSAWDIEGSGWDISAGGATSLNTEQMQDPQIFEDLGFDPEIWHFPDEQYPVVVWNQEVEELITVSGDLIFVNSGFYENNNIGNKGYYLAFQSNDPAEYYLIYTEYSIDSTNPAVQLFPTPENIGAYVSFSFYNMDQEAVDMRTVLAQEDYFLINFTEKPNQLWYRYMGTEWMVVPGYNKNTFKTPDYTYEISIAGLNLPNRNGSNIIEFAGDAGIESQTLPVELSLLSADLTNEVLVRINWRAETETNMLGYNIYRSKDNNLNNAKKLNFVIIAAYNRSTARDYFYIDKDVLVDNTYYYWLQSNDLDLTNEFFGLIMITVEDREVSSSYLVPDIVTELKGAYPNPFNPGTHISFSLSDESLVTLRIYNPKGQYLRTLIDNKQYLSGRNHSIYWDGTDYKGEKTGSGLYLYIIKTDNGYQEAKKMIMMK